MIMEEQLITFETAKLAKEKKAILKTNIAYVYRNVEHQNISYKGILTAAPLLCDIPAPTQSLLQKWLREVYNLHVNVTEHIFNQYGFEIRLKTDCVHYWNCSSFTNTKYFYESYEEALEIGLQEALQLIKT